MSALWFMQYKVLGRRHLSSMWRGDGRRKREDVLVLNVIAVQMRLFAKVLTLYYDDRYIAHHGMFTPNRIRTTKVTNFCKENEYFVCFLLCESLVYT